ncbi:hypothetical protein [Streptodolium elevatio]|uniref:Uncharacterized protein n=1 Tax=Streptodolium elevatio TaxID=3157996 RepID=A0ABV3DM75_9ACTN
MAQAEHGGYRKFLGGFARALIAEDDIWQVRTSADGRSLVGRADDGRSSVVALVDAGSLDATVTVEDVERTASLAARVGATADDGQPAAFLCSRRKPAGAAVQAAYLRNIRILNVRSAGADSWGHNVAIVSRQEFGQMPDAPVLDEGQWQAIHDGSHSAVFLDSRQNPIATFPGLCAELAWHEETETSSWGSAWGIGRFTMPPGTLMAVPDQPPIPVTGVTFNFHKEMRRLRAAGEEAAYAALAANWLWA